MGDRTQIEFHRAVTPISAVSKLPKSQQRGGRLIRAALRGCALMVAATRFLPQPARQHTKALLLGPLRIDRLGVGSSCRGHRPPATSAMASSGRRSSATAKLLSRKNEALSDSIAIAEIALCCS